MSTNVHSVEHCPNLVSMDRNEGVGKLVPRSSAHVEYLMVKTEPLLCATRNL